MISFHWWNRRILLSRWQVVLVRFQDICIFLTQAQIVWIRHWLTLLCVLWRYQDSVWFLYINFWYGSPLIEARERRWLEPRPVFYSTRICEVVRKMSVLLNLSNGLFPHHWATKSNSPMFPIRVGEAMSASRSFGVMCPVKVSFGISNLKI